MSPRDSGRTAFYEAERLILRMFDNVGVTRSVRVAGAELTLPIEARFATADAVGEYVERVLALAAVRQRFARARVPVTVRARRGHRAAEYRRGPGLPDAEIAIPESREGRWALRELVVLHEIAHHLDDSESAVHGRDFALTVIDLVGLVLGPEAGLVYRVILSDSDVV